MSRMFGLLASIAAMFGSYDPHTPVGVPGNPVRRNKRDVPYSSKNTLSTAEQAKLKGFKEFTIDGCIYYAATRNKANKLHKGYLNRKV